MTARAQGREWVLRVSSEDTGGRFAVLETRERPGAEPPRHVHSREDELVCVLEGRVTFFRDGEAIDGTAGTWIFLPRGSEHAFVVESAEARLLVLLSPAGFEECLDELRQPSETVPEYQLIERMVATSARYGVTIAGPARQPASKGEHENAVSPRSRQSIA